MDNINMGSLLDLLSYVEKQMDIVENNQSFYNGLLEYEYYGTIVLPNFHKYINFNIPKVSLKECASKDIKGFNPLKSGLYCNSYKSIMNTRGNGLVCFNPLKSGLYCNVIMKRRRKMMSEFQSP